MVIDWTKKGQVIDIGWTGSVISPWWGIDGMTFYVDEHGNFFASSEFPLKFNPVTGDKIESIIIASERQEEVKYV